MYLYAIGVLTEIEIEVDFFCNHLLMYVCDVDGHCVHAGS